MLQTVFVIIFVQKLYQSASFSVMSAESTYTSKLLTYLELESHGYGKDNDLLFV